MGENVRAKNIAECIKFTTEKYKIEDRFDRCGPSPRVNVPKSKTQAILSASILPIYFEILVPPALCKMVSKDNESQDIPAASAFVFEPADQLGNLQFEYQQS